MAYPPLLLSLLLGAPHGLDDRGGLMFRRVLLRNELARLGTASDLRHP